MKPAWQQSNKRQMPSASHMGTPSKAGNNKEHDFGPPYATGYTRNKSGDYFRSHPFPWWDNDPHAIFVNTF